jgi:hypothetical protein
MAYTYQDCIIDVHKNGVEASYNNRTYFPLVAGNRYRVRRDQKLFLKPETPTSGTNADTNEPNKEYSIYDQDAQTLEILPDYNFKQVADKIDEMKTEMTTKLEAVKVATEQRIDPN